MKKFYLSAAALAASLALPGLPAMAQTNEITIGITVTTTGPAAALGIPERNALEFVAKEIGCVPLELIVLDDGGDPTNATTNARRFVTESKADIIMGSSTTPPSAAVSDVANEAGIPHFGLKAKLANLNCESCARAALDAMTPRRDPKFGVTFKWLDSKRVNIKEQTITAFVRFNNTIHIDEMTRALTQAGLPPLSLHVVLE